MKRTLFIIPCALALGAVLLALNWRIRTVAPTQASQNFNPPPTHADQSFARLTRGADEVEITSCLGHKQALLKADDLRGLVQNIHLNDKPGMVTQGCDSLYTLEFKRRGNSLAKFDVDFDAGTLSQNSSLTFHPSIEGHTRRNLERALLDALSRPSSTNASS